MAAFNILVVDDAAFVRDLVKKAVRETYTNCELFEANDGRKALSVMNVKKIDVVLCDWEMPEISGLEVLQWMRADERYKKVPLIMITSRGDRDHVIKAVEAGVSEYISKPFTYESFVHKLTKLVWRHLKIQPQEAVAINLRAVGAVDVLGATAVNPNSVVKTKGQDLGGASVLIGASAAKLNVQQQLQPQKNEAKDGVKAGVRGAVKSRGIADVRFASGGQAKLVIKDINLQELIGVFRRTGDLPALLEQAVLDINDADSDSMARINGYVRMMQAQEPHPDAETIQMVIRYVDDDPEKLAALSRYIAKVR